MKCQTMHRLLKLWITNHSLRDGDGHDLQDPKRGHHEPEPKLGDYELTGRTTKKDGITTTTTNVFLTSTKLNVKFFTVETL